MNAIKNDLQEYRNETWGTDWSIYFDHQVTEKEMEQTFELRHVGFLVWSRCRKDGITIAWCQTRQPLCKFVIEEWFQHAAWIGSTTGNEEYDAWFGGLNRDCFLFIGSFSPRYDTGMTAGRHVIGEICAATAALSMEMEDNKDNDDDPTDIGHLKRTYNKYF